LDGSGCQKQTDTSEKEKTSLLMTVAIYMSECHWNHQGFAKSMDCMQ